MNTKYILLGLAAWLGITFLEKSKAANQLNFFVQRVSVRLEGLTPILDILVGCQNPTNQLLTVSSILGGLKINGNFIANIYSYQVTQIRPYNVSTLPISARLAVGGLFGEIKDIINLLSAGSYNAILNQTISFNGTIRAEGVNIPMAFDYKVL